jgi:hypothetical protein
VLEKPKYYLKIKIGRDCIFLECDKGTDSFLDLLLVLQERKIKYDVIGEADYLKGLPKISNNEFFKKYNQKV